MPSRVENETEHVCMCARGERRRERHVWKKKRERGGERVRGREREWERLEGEGGAGR